LDLIRQQGVPRKAIGEAKDQAAGGQLNRHHGILDQPMAATKFEDLRVNSYLLSGAEIWLIC
jgi:hypothetical protein